MTLAPFVHADHDLVVNLNSGEGVGESPFLTPA